MDLDFMPSPVDDRPGLLIRDPFAYSSAVLIVPPLLIPLLELFDGRNSLLEARERLYRATGELDSGDVVQHLAGTLAEAGFLEDETFARLRDSRRAEFAASPTRLPAHAGSAYPDNAPELRETMDRYFAGAAPDTAVNHVVGIAAPHVSPEGGWESYRDAYRHVSAAADDRVFVVLGTSHYGAPERFGLTRKPYLTPFGAAQTETALVDELERRAPGAVLMEDYCHAVEHSIEFQVAFLQSVCGPGIRILPILCGPYAESTYHGGLPEDDDNVARFLDALRELSAREGKRLFWVLGVDMAHLGSRYGDQFEARAHQGPLEEAAVRDRARIDAICRCDAAAYWSLVQENHDDLKWCGSAPFYTFLRVAPFAAGTLHRYQQWNIDEASVVSFGSLSFS
jgi:hypothetical protein